MDEYVIKFRILKRLIKALGVQLLEGKNWVGFGAIGTGGVWYINPSDPHLWYQAFIILTGGGAAIGFILDFYITVRKLEDEENGAKTGS